ncbi:MAG: DUF2953 domain-containing protein [Clostridia bacterium]|nr:DUF2953 domain-containing protein [Clostridia bacterium]
MTVLIIVLAVLALLLLLPVKADVSFLLLGGQDRLCVKAGIVAPFLTVFDSTKKKAKKKKKKEESETEKEEPDKKKEKKNKKKYSFEQIKKLLKMVFDALAFVKKHLVISNLKLHFHMGFDDAAQTGIAVGSAWGFLYDFVALCDRKFKLKKHSVHVAPDFTQEVFETDLNVKLSFKLIYAIIVAVKILKGMRKL